MSDRTRCQGCGHFNNELEHAEQFDRPSTECKVYGALGHWMLPVDKHGYPIHPKLQGKKPWSIEVHGEPGGAGADIRAVFKVGCQSFDIMEPMPANDEEALPRAHWFKKQFTHAMANIGETPSPAAPSDECEECERALEDPLSLYVCREHGTSKPFPETVTIVSNAPCKPHPGMTISASGMAVCTRCRSVLFELPDV